MPDSPPAPADVSADASAVISEVVDKYADDLVAFRGQEAAETVAEQRVIVGDEDAHRGAV